MGISKHSEDLYGIKEVGGPRTKLPSWAHHHGTGITCHSGTLCSAHDSSELREHQEPTLRESMAGKGGCPADWVVCNQSQVCEGRESRMTGWKETGLGRATQTPIPTGGRGWGTAVKSPSSEPRGTRCAPWGEALGSSSSASSADMGMITSLPLTARMWTKT